MTSAPGVSLIRRGSLRSFKRERKKEREREREREKKRLRASERAKEKERVRGREIERKIEIGREMMMIAFITIKSSLVPLIEGLCAQI